MYNNSSKIMFLMIMVTGTLMSVSSSSWLGAWMGLEINLLAFIPLMTASGNLMSSEAALKYFLTQALASSVLLMSIIIYSMIQWTYETMSMNMSLSALLLKLGAAPFHWWFPSVMSGLSWSNCMILMTWQKIAPMMLSSYLINQSTENLMMMSMLMSATVGALGGLNQSMLKKMMAFSSINHISWMIAAMESSEPLWLCYFTMYSVLNANMIMMFKTTEASHLNQMFSSTFSSKIMKFSIVTGMLSLGGLPPFLGFMPKMLVIQSMIYNNQILMMMILTMMSLITLFFYMRITHSTFMLNLYETSWNTKQQKSNMMSTLMMTSFLSNSGLVSMSMMYYML